MPQHKSAKKRVRQNNKKKLANKSVLTRYRSAITEFINQKMIIEKNNSEQAF